MLYTLLKYIIGTALRVCRSYASY